MRRSVHIVVAAVLALVALGVAAPGCGSGDVGPSSHKVGGRCGSDGDCDKRCVTGIQFPGGYCTITCTGDKDCPGGSACVMSSNDEGICLATCQVPTDCAGYGSGYQCNRQPRQSGTMGALVCIAG